MPSGERIPLDPNEGDDTDVAVLVGVGITSLLPPCRPPP